MLEQYPEHACGKGPSDRLKDVTHFLEEAVKVVPIESIFSAIAYMDNDTALECAKAIVAAEPQIPPSLMMLTGAQKAVVRLRTSIHPHLAAIIADDFARIVVSTRRCITRLPPRVSISAPKHNQLRVIVAVPVGYQVMTYSDMIQGRTPQIVVDRYERTYDLSPYLSSDSPTHPKLASRLEKYTQVQGGEKILEQVSNLSIEHVYPVDSHRRHTMRTSTLQSPLEVLRDTREKIASFIEDSQKEDLNSSQGTQSSNEQMLTLVRDINEHNLRICAALLGAFMEEQIRIPLLKSEMDTAGVLSEKSSPVAMGVWALFSMGYKELKAKLSSLQGNPLLVKITDYISGVLSDNLKKPSYAHRSSKYDAKLQFLLQGIKRTVSCSSQYISYSLEHQLCSNLKFEKDIPVKKLISDWDKIFHGDALSLVAKSHRPLIARWLKWAVLIHDLREALAKYTCVGVTGLVNSGKSQLVSKLFGVQVHSQRLYTHTCTCINSISIYIYTMQAAVGTTEHKRTTVPLLYNLDGKVNGLDVIDFPGVDDKDHSIPQLAQLLLGLVQVVVFVVDYKYVNSTIVGLNVITYILYYNTRRIFSDVAKEWLHLLEAEDVPVVVCMTHADLRYNECMEKEEGNPEPTPFKINEIGADLMVRNVLSVY